MTTRGLWCGAGDCGQSRHDVVEFVKKVAGAGFNLLLPELKGGHGLLRYPSKKFRQAVEPGYEEFDLPAHLLDACKSHGVEVHAWFIDFFEGEDGPAFRTHPDWAALDKSGSPTNNETLRGERFTGLWMCPARLPGYADQWLQPIYEEFVELYEFDGVHHDYVRYPGDLAPDQYCFCDYCLEQIPAWAGYSNSAFPDEPFEHALYDREYLEAHWEQSPKVLPTIWSKLNRQEKSRFLLEGSFFRFGRDDLDYFFYQYRKEAVCKFVRNVHQMVKSVRPTTEISAAVFKNPVHSGRFIGQDWREFTPYVDTMIPMDYRDHFPGTMDHYLALLSESIERQKTWSQGSQRYLTGFAIWPLVRDPEPESARADHFAETVRLVKAKNHDGCCVFCAGDMDKHGLWDVFQREL